MNGLEAILNRIMTDAEDRIRDIREQADARCAEILEQAGQEATRITDDARRKAAEQSETLFRRSESLSSLEARKSILAGRQALIDETIDQAASRLAAMPDAEKSRLYHRLLMESAGGNETVVFAGQDMALARQLLETVNREKGWNLVLDSNPGMFSGGMILRKDLIETNLTVDLLIRSRRPELVSLAAKALFGN